MENHCLAAGLTVLDVLQDLLCDCDEISEIFRIFPAAFIHYGTYAFKTRDS